MSFRASWVVNPRAILPQAEDRTLDAMFGRRVLQDERCTRIGRHPLIELFEIRMFADGLY